MIGIFQMNPGAQSFFYFLHIDAAAQALVPLFSAFPGTSAETGKEIEQPVFKLEPIWDANTVGGSLI